MNVETNGLVLKNVRIARDRKMLVILTRKFGKISVGTSITPRSRKQSQLPLGAFTYGRYELYKNRDSFNLDAADTIESFFDIAGDVDKYFAASCALEFTEQVLPYEEPSEAVLDALLEYLRIVSSRKSHYSSLLLIYQWKVMFLAGYMPELDRCCRCGSGKEPAAFSIPDGGIVCGDCKNQCDVNNALLYSVNSDIIKILKFVANGGMKAFERLSLRKDIEEYLTVILKETMSYHLGIKELKSESYLEKF